jgi:hypothetical protein
MGYAMASTEGEVFGFGSVGDEWGVPVFAPDQRLAGLAFTPSGRGCWLAASDGTVVCRGDAPNLGSPKDLGVTIPIVAMAPAPDGFGYYAAVANGGLYTFGSAGFHGSLGGEQLNQPIVDVAVSPLGYWLVAGDGGVFAFGGVRYCGSAADIGLTSQIVAIAATPSGLGYWLATGDGQVLTFGDAVDFGCLADLGVDGPVIGMCSSRQVFGYWMATASGVVRAFGDTYFLGNVPPATLTPSFVAFGTLGAG